MLTADDLEAFAPYNLDHPGMSARSVNDLFPLLINHPPRANANQWLKELIDAEKDTILAVAEATLDELPGEWEWSPLTKAAQLIQALSSSRQQSVTNYAAYAELLYILMHQRGFK